MRIKTISALKLPASGDQGQALLEEGSIFFIGTATVLFRYGGLTILTDPNFLHKGDHVHLGYGLFSQRVTSPAITIDQLPPIDLVLLSHYHGDHFDRIAERKLDRTVPIVTTPHAAASLRRKGFRATYPLRTWQSQRVTKGETKITITAMPGRHGPRGISALLPPVMGSMIEIERGGEYSRPYRIYISGDTLVHDDLNHIPEIYPDIDLALLHLGGTRVVGVLVTMDAKQGVEAIRLLDPDLTIPIHFNDYKVFKSPITDFQKAVVAAGLQDKVHYLRHGDTYTFKVRRAATWNEKHTKVKA